MADAAEAVEQATRTLLQAIARADALVRDHPDYDGTRFGSVIASYVHGRVGGVLGISARPRRDVPSLRAALAPLD